MLITYIMGLTTFILCLIVGCRSDYLHSRYSESGESSESIYPQSSDFYLTKPRPPLLPHPVPYYTGSRYFTAFNTGPGPFINHQPPPPHHHSWKPNLGSDRMMINHNGYSGPGPVSLKPQVVAENLPVSYDGASLSDRNPSIHYWRTALSTLSSKLSSSNYRNEPISGSEYGYAESAAHSIAKPEDDDDDDDDDDDQDSQESRIHEYSVETTQSSSTEQSNSNAKDGSING